MCPCECSPSVLHEQQKMGSHSNVWGSEVQGWTCVWGPYNRDYSVLGSVLWSPYLGKIVVSPFTSRGRRALPPGKVSKYLRSLSPLSR